VDDLRDRYARLVAAFGADQRTAADLDQLAADAGALAAATELTWLRIQSRALAEAARAAAGADPELETIVDAPLPPVDATAVVRLDELLPAGGSLAERLAAHDSAIRLPTDALRPAAERLLDLLRRRAAEDLELPEEHRLALHLVERPGTTWRARLEATPTARLLLNAGVGWSVDRLTDAISSLAYPGEHLARLMRPPSAEWGPSPQTTVDTGLAAVGREILLADHELAHELDRIGRAAGMRWDGGAIIAIRRALDDLLPAYAAVAFGAEREAGQLVSLGEHPRSADALIRAWRDPLARASALAGAAGPPLVRSWLVVTGQTIGLQRLLGERLVPTMLRAEIADATG
jgi:hypothetical protein